MICRRLPLDKNLRFIYLSKINFDEVLEVIDPTPKGGGLAVSLSHRVRLYDFSPAPSYIQRGIDVCIQRVPARYTDKILLVSSAFLINVPAF